MPPDADYANHPPSITEAKAQREHDSRLWTPRDALISALRDYDSGERVFEAVVIVGRSRDEGETHTSFYNATPDVHTALGLLARGQFRLMED